MDKRSGGCLGYLTEEQEKTYVMFKIEVIRRCEDEWDYDINQFDNYDYLRFLRARKFDLEKTIEMFDKYIKWRKEMEVDKILSYKFPELVKVKEIYPHGYHKTDKLGRPVYIERLGMLDLDKLFKVTTKERFLKYFIREYEKLIHFVHPVCSIMIGKKIETSITIIDMNGGGSSLFIPSTINFVKLTSSICQDYYPETLGMMYIVNTSWLFQTVWMIVKGFLDPKTKEKIKILGGRFKEELLEQINAENLPDFLGGTCKCDPLGCLNCCNGPWRPFLSKFGSENNPEDTRIPPRPEKWKQCFKFHSLYFMLIN